MHFTYVLHCNILKVDAYFHRTCTSGTVQSSQPSTFIAHPSSLASDCSLLTLYLLSPFQPPRHYLFFYYLHLIPSSTSYQSLVIRPSLTNTNTLYHSPLSYCFNFSILTFLAIIYHDSPLLGLFLAYWPFYSCVCCCVGVCLKGLSSILFTHAGTYTCIIVLAFLSCQTHSGLAQPCISKHALGNIYFKLFEHFFFSNLNTPSF